MLRWGDALEAKLILLMGHGQISYCIINILFNIIIYIKFILKITLYYVNITNIFRLLINSGGEINPFSELLG